jgi:hypothetical protein
MLTPQSDGLPNQAMHAGAGYTQPLGDGRAGMEILVIQLPQHGEQPRV